MKIWKNNIKLEKNEYRDRVIKAEEQIPDSYLVTNRQVKKNIQVGNPGMICKFEKEYTCPHHYIQQWFY